MRSRFVQGRGVGIGLPAMLVTRRELWEQLVYDVTGGLAIAACVGSLLLIVAHLRHFSNPRQQKLIVRLLLMVPIYAIDSFFSLRWREVTCGSRVAPFSR